MNNTSFRPGNSLDRLRDVIDRGLPKADFTPDMYGAPEAPMTVQQSPFIAGRNYETARHALNHIRPEDMAEFLADYLISRTGRVKASMIGADIARIAETGK